MLIFLAVVFVVFTTHKLTTAQQAGCSGPPSSTQVATLIASNLNGPQGSAIITLQMSPAGFTFRVVCLSSSGIRNQYRFASIVAYYSENEGTPQYGQFEFECVSSVWSATGNLLDAAIFNRVVPLAENSSAINATNRTDCAYCLNRVSPSLPRFTDTVNHCSACSGCAQPLCYITDTSLPSSGSNFTSVCCNYYVNISGSITCTTACPPSSYPDGNRTCVPCSLTCQNGGTLRSDSCACSCTAVSTGSDCSGCLCQNGGTCSGGTCTCPPGYSGPLCDTLCPTSCPTGYYLNNCSCVPVCSVVCQNGGTCSGGTCTCPPVYSGPLCSTCIHICPTGYYLNRSTCSCAPPVASPNRAKCDAGCIAGAIIGAVLGTILLAGIVAAVIVGVYFATHGAGAATKGMALSGPNGTAKDNPLYLDPKIVEDSVAQ